VSIIQVLAHVVVVAPGFFIKIYPSSHKYTKQTQQAYHHPKWPGGRLVSEELKQHNSYSTLEEHVVRLEHHDGVAVSGVFQHLVLQFEGSEGDDVSRFNLNGDVEVLEV